MPEEKPYKIEPNIEASLCYIPLVGLAVLFTEKNNKFIRFHAIQSLYFWLVAFAIYSMTMVLRVIIIGFILQPFVNALIIGAAIYTAWKAYKEEEFELPVIGRLANEQK